MLELMMVTRRISRPGYQQQQRINPTNPVANELFGFSVAMSRDAEVLLIGSRLGNYVGVFKKVDGIYTLVQKLVSSSPTAEEWFGTTVTLSRDGTHVAIFSSTDTLAGRGAVTIFKSVGGSNFQLVQRIPNLEAGNYQVFGRDCLFSYDNLSLFIGSTGLNAAYLYTSTGSTYSFIQKITAFGTSTDGRFGSSFAISQDGATLFVGAPNNGNLGRVFTYTKSGASYTNGVVIEPPSPIGASLFGESMDLSMDGDILVIGRPGLTVSGNSSAGALYLYAKNAGIYQFVKQIISPTPLDSDQVGQSVKISDDGQTIVSTSKRPYLSFLVFKGNGTNHTFYEKVSTTAPTTGAVFRSLLAIDETGDIVSLGTPTQNGTQNAEGATYLYSLR